MTQTLSTNLLMPVNANENSALRGTDHVSAGLTEPTSVGEFTAVMQDIMLAGGKTKPLDIAGLKDLDIQQLTDLAEQMGIQLTAELLPESINPEQLAVKTLALEAKDAVDGLNLIGNPNANKLIKTIEINDDLLKEGLSEDSLYKNQINKADLFARATTTEQLQQLVMKKEPGLTPALNSSDLESSQFMKELAFKDADISRELLMQPSRQDINTIKLTEQFVSVDRPNNAINALSNPAAAVQTQLNSEPSAMLTNRIAVPVQQAGWGEAVGNRLIMMVNDKMQSANIHLNPAELGPIEVKISVNQDQTTVHFVSSNSVVREAIEDAFPRLKEMFSQNGLTLADANVSQQSSQQNQSYSKDENNSQSTVNNNALENDESPIDSSQINTIDTGLIDHYV